MLAPSYEYDWARLRHHYRPGKSIPDLDSGELTTDYTFYNRVHNDYNLRSTIILVGCDATTD
jgi:hypothetical protein